MTKGNMRKTTSSWMTCLLWSALAGCGGDPAVGADAARPDASTPDAFVVVPDGGTDAAGSPDTGSDAGAPWTATVAPTSVHVSAGGSTLVAIDVVRPAGSDGAIDVTVTGLPTGASASAITIAAGETHADLGLSALTGAAPASADATVTLVGVGQTVPLPLRVRIVGAPGTIDPSFGAMGALQLAAGSSETATVVGPAIDRADGVVFVLRQSLMRATRDGVLDTSFGTGGSTALPAPTGLTVETRQIVATPDGHILVVGRVVDNMGSGAMSAIWRFTSTGALDPTFATGGALFHDVDPARNEEADAIALLSNGYAVAGLVAGPQWFVLQLDLDGVLDASFATSGVLRFAPSGGIGISPPQDLGRLSDGRLRLLGNFFTPAPALAPMISLVGVTGAGAIEAGFGTAGFAEGPGSPSSFLVDGTRLLVLGRTSTNVANVLAVLSSGMPDTSFGGTGSIGPTFGAPPANVIDGAIDSGGRISVIASITDTTPQLGFGRFSTTGAADTSVGVAGTVHVTLPTGVTNVRPVGMGVQSDGSIIVIGVTSTGASMAAPLLLRLAS